MVHFGNPTGVWTDGQWWYFRRVEKGTSCYSAVTGGGGGLPKITVNRILFANGCISQNGATGVQTGGFREGRGAGAAVSFSKRFSQDPRGSTEPLVFLSVGQSGTLTAEGLSSFLCFSSLSPNATSHRISNYVYQIF